ncbi:MAG TPA: hypothetical protein PLX06_01515 [Fimbriimonadaceae bacterium]|nr:hypothetical protein [Fimbriimonadaceae bacterium]
MDYPYENPMAATMWWSFGRDRRLIGQIESELRERGVYTIDIWSDPDLNRTLVAFSGDHALVTHCAIELGRTVLPSVDLRRHAGTHPRTGALDLIRFSPLNENTTGIGALDMFGTEWARIHDIPVFADGPGSDAASERRILDVRAGGFGKLAGQILEPTYGPRVAHEQWGVTSLFVGPPQLTAILELDDPTSKAAERVARELLELRFQGDPLMFGVHAEGYSQATRDGSLLLLTFEMADEAYPDQVLKVAEKEARLLGAAAGKARALGIWRTSDLAKATRLIVNEDRQVWDDIFI